MLESKVSFDPEVEGRRRAEIAHTALGLIFTPAGPWPSFTFGRLAEKTAEVLKLEREEMRSVLGELEIMMLENYWLRIIKPVSPKDLPEDSLNILYQIDGERQSVLVGIEDFRAVLAGAAGKTLEAQQHRVQANSLRRQPVTD